MPTVSVIIPTHNRARLVVEAIRSVLSQTYTEFEIVVVDDASTDGTPEKIAKEFGAEIRKEKLRYLRNASHQERSLTRNRAIEAARGEYLAFLDDDDLLLPAHLENCVCRLQRCDVVGTGVILTDINANSISEYTFPFLGRLQPNELALLGLGINNSNAVMRNEVVQRAGLFRVGLHQGEDIDFWMRVAMTATVELIPEKTVLRRAHPENYTFNVEQALHVRFLDGLKAMLLENARSLHCPLSARVLGYLHLYIAWNGACHGQRDYALKRLQEALRIYPLLAVSEPYSFRLMGRLLLLADGRLYKFFRKVKRQWKHLASAS